MSLTDELQRLQELHESGAMSAAEFAQAKAVLLSNPPGNQPQNSGKLPVQRDLLGEAAKTFVSFYIIMAIVGLVISAILFFTIFLPMWQKAGGAMDRFPKDFEDHFDKFHKDSNKRMEDFRKQNGF